jgi:hypothetical protein
LALPFSSLLQAYTIGLEYGGGTCLRQGYKG